VALVGGMQLPFGTKQYHGDHRRKQAHHARQLRPSIEPDVKQSDGISKRKQQLGLSRRSKAKQAGCLPTF